MSPPPIQPKSTDATTKRYHLCPSLSPHIKMGVGLEGVSSNTAAPPFRFVETDVMMDGKDRVLLGAREGRIKQGYMIDTMQRLLEVRTVFF